MQGMDELVGCFIIALKLFRSCLLECVFFDNDVDLSANEMHLLLSLTFIRLLPSISQRIFNTDKLRKYCHQSSLPMAVKKFVPFVTS